MQTASHWAAPYIVRHGSYSASLSTISTFHFFSRGPCLPAAPSMSFCMWATPKTLQEGYSLQASENWGAAANAGRAAATSDNILIHFIFIPPLLRETGRLFL